MPSGFRPAARSAARTRSTMSRRAATSRTRWRGPSCVVDDPERLEVEHRVLERHRDLVLRLEAHGRLELLGVLEGGSSTMRTTIFWLATPMRTRLSRPLLAPVERAQGVGQAVDVGDLAVADDARLERRDAACSTRSRPLTRNGGGDDAGGSMSSPTRVLVRLAMEKGRRLLGCRVPPSHRHRAGGPERGDGGRPTCVHGRLARGRRVRTCRGRRRRARRRRRRRRGRRARGTARTAPRSCGPRGALAGDDRRADDHARDQRDEDGRRDGAAEVQPQDRGELDVAHAHAARVEQRGEEEEAAAGDPATIALHQEVRVERRDGDERGDGGRAGEPVGDDPVVEVDQRDRHQHRHEQQAEDDAHGVVLRGHDGDVERAGGQLDERVARGDRLAAVAAAPAQQQPRDAPARCR